MSAAVSRGTALAFDVPSGRSLRLVVRDGAPVVDLAVSGMHPALTRNIAGARRFGRPSLALWLCAGDTLVDGDARPIAVIDEDPGEGQVDVAYPGCWRELYPDGRQGCRDLLAGALGIERRSLPGVISLFGATPRLADGGLHGWEGVAARPGDALELRALEPFRVAVSGCPDDDIPGASGGTVVVEILEAA